MEILTEDNYYERITGLSKADWQPLLDLIPEVENASSFCTVHEGLEEDVIYLYPTFDESDVVLRFREIVQDLPLIIDFNWGGWDEGKRMVGDENFNYDTIDIPTKCKIITAIVRNDRFCSGRLVSAFEDGLMLKVLKSIKRQLK
ncbi:MAG: DUF6508 domain-containing protein [Bacteroidales bacterium]|nr:DUF6508 domain-containing protein [Bacteroidales bacterium]MCF8343817.1 DUF6508 domain-containing protein [Bacteroidales bacterium]MCF8350085.1 DUF6508 domain-containing protein [Bacteroidales bacterium]MCF8374971.1 DUF6508 domain-containing protein [Bacteroidales bacterium]MCF8402125.1 DUF6508 domain-containing protein [Bacteroidales bacterium]